MNVNMHAEYGQQRAVARRWPVLLVVALLVAIDATAVWFIARMWDRLTPYLPWALAAVVAFGLFVRARSAFRGDR
jgi:hypothetical protein